MKKHFLCLFFALVVMSCVCPLLAQTLVFHLPDGGLSTVSLPATFSISPSGDKLVIESGDTRVELDRNRILAMTYSGRKGDVNDDMAVDVADIATIISIMAGGVEPAVSLDVSSASLSFESSADSKQVKVACNGSWTASSSQSWCAVSPVSGTGDGTLTIAVSENANGESRSATLTVKAGTLTKTLNVTQEGKAVSDSSCPDGNHPHWIDLGIGTLWRCCNEGASRPEEHGGYYTFGQVASAPTLDQIKALVDNCSYTWTTQNGVNGGKFTGPNGGTIFLPAAGYVWGGELGNVGSNGDYWSSTPYDEGYAYGLYFSLGGAGWGYGDRRIGHTVRPVR